MAERAYAATSQAVSVTGSQDLIEIAPASNKVVTIRGFSIGAAGGTADAADAQEELLSYSVCANATATGSGGTTITPAPLNQNDAAAGATVKANNTTKAGGSPNRVFMEGTWNNRVEELVFFPPELMPVVANDDVFELRLNTAPADSLAISTTVWFDETP